MTENKASIRSDRYDRKNTTRLYIKLNNNTDSDILEALDKVENKQGFIKSLIRHYIKSNM